MKKVIISRLLNYYKTLIRNTLMYNIRIKLSKNSSSRGGTGKFFIGCGYSSLSRAVPTKFMHVSSNIRVQLSGQSNETRFLYGIDFSPTKKHSSVLRTPRCEEILTTVALSFIFGTFFNFLCFLLLLFI